MKSSARLIWNSPPKVLLLILCVSGFLASGCAKVDVSPVVPGTLLPDLTNRISGGEVVSGAAVGQKTLLNRYVVDSSAGIQYSNLQAKTPNGYKVYFGVKGAMLSSTK